MDLSSPGADLLGPIRARVLSALARTTEPVSGREVARLADGLAPSSTHRELRSLVMIGLVTARPSSHATTYTLNREHVLWPPLLEILTSIARVEQRIRDLVDQHVGRDVSCALFGSVARGDSTPHSDIDVLIVTGGELPVDALDTLRDYLTQFTGNTPQLVAITRDQLSSMVVAGDPLVDSWQAELRMISGPEVRDLIRKARS